MGECLLEGFAGSPERESAEGVEESANVVGSVEGFLRIERGGSAGGGGLTLEGVGDTGDVVDELDLGLDELEIVAHVDVGVTLDDGVTDGTPR